MSERINARDLDNYLTGHGGEDFFRGESDATGDPNPVAVAFVPPYLMACDRLAFIANGLRNLSTALARQTTSAVALMAADNLNEQATDIEAVVTATKEMMNVTAQSLHSVIPEIEHGFCNECDDRESFGSIWVILRQHAEDLEKAAGVKR